MMTDRRVRRYVSCPVCGKILFKGYGNCNIEVTCSTCKRDIVALLDDEKVMVLENRRGSRKDAGAGQVRVSVQKTKNPQMAPVRKAANY